MILKIECFNLFIKIFRTFLILLNRAIHPLFTRKNGKQTGGKEISSMFPLFIRFRGFVFQTRVR